MSSPEEAFGQVLKRFRAEKGLSQQQLALESNLDRTFISLMERGLRQPSLTTILQLSVVLGIAPSKLIAEVERQLAFKPGDAQ